MNILVLCPFYPTRYSFWAGPWIHSQSRALLSLEHRVRVLRVNEQNREEIHERGFLFKCFDQELDGIPVHTCYFPKVPKLDKLTNALKHRKYRKEIAKLHEHWPIDLVFLHFSESFESQIALELKRRLGIPYMLLENSSTFLEGPDRVESLRSFEQVFLHASPVMAVSQKLSAVITRLFPVDVVEHPNVIDTDYFCPGGDHESGAFTFVTVGSLVDRKNHLNLVDAFASVFRDRKEFRLVICGEGPTRPALEEKIALYDLAARIELTGKLNQEEIRQRLRRASVFVFPTFSETFGVSAIEAMACGLPVVSTRSGGPEEFIDETVGILCDPATDSLAHAMEEATTKPWNRKEIRQRVVEKYSVHSAARRFEDILKTIPPLHHVRQEGSF